MRSSAKTPFSGLRLAFHRLFGLRTTTLDGLTLLCDTKLVPRNVSTAIIKGSYELPERQLVRATIRNGDRVVEVGSGVGVVGLLCNKLAGAGNVLSFEANSTLASIIAANYALNNITPRIRLRAVTIDGAPISFYRNSNIISSSVFDRGLEAENVTVESEALDQVLNGERADVLVMDVEGAEIDLLTTADLSGVREIIVELHPKIVGVGPTKAMIDSIIDRGFIENGRIQDNIRLSRKP
jgi:FkbM family methyltransferase